MSEEFGSVSQETSVVTPVVQPAPAQQAPSEPMIPQSQVNHIVSKRVNESSESAEKRGYERAKSELLSQQTQSTTPVSTTQASTDEERIRKIIAEQSEKIRTEGAVNHALETFRTRVSEGLTDPDYPDYRETVEALNVQEMTPVALLASTFENTKDIMYQLGKQPGAAGTILNLLSNPATVRLAQMELQNISNSIKVNKEAKKSPTANPPLSQIRASTTGVDSGALTFEEVRRKASLRC